MTPSNDTPARRVALVDDDHDVRIAASESLSLAGYHVDAHASAQSFLDSLAHGYPDVLVTDMRMPGLDGLQLFERVLERDASLPVIFITGHGDIAQAVEAMRRGAYDFLEKPYATHRLLTAVGHAWEKRQLVLENRRLQQASEGGQSDWPLLGISAPMVELRETIRHIADADVDVLLVGETGTGKEMAATALHQWSRRRAGQLVALNCGALPESVIESELFGHEPGAFTGAQRRRVGRIEHSSGGTLFLDEIESMPPAVQLKLLRVLETRSVDPLGTNELRPVDLRVVAASKVDLADPSQRGAFREDLYYRLNVVTLHLPPLRQRREDIGLLFDVFCTQAASRFRREVPALGDGVRRYLDEHDWPGNVRELLHFAERFVLGVTALTPGARLGQVRTAQAEATAAVQTPSAGAPGTPGSLAERVDRYEAQLIRDTLAANGGSVRETLETLAIARKTLYDKMQRYGIDRREYLPAKDG
ncbi:sigma-54 dependent transcriptional regulator [Cupriavidus sp. AU9028]|uniref:sigma-54-dependent transcriptional regulator n=1 Tax=Cupriavidus sp. AU9028 TaxID=2871157 RepID=UPI001C97C8BC|nr:sigma-54 dependent transcriptional regulator [Cupriavidus sp. AU9028]MBY4897643.1 sigma-54 dependent transcriptional regulator [Cupriavidus sp. AU9028]